MKTELACLPCFLSQVDRTLRYTGVNGDLGRALLQQAIRIIEGAPLSQVPARTSTVIHRMLRVETGQDPYRAVKKKYNQIALEMLPRLTSLAVSAADPLEGAVRIAIAGNIIDFGIYETVDLDRAVEDSFTKQFVPSIYRDFSDAVRESRKILYLCDNAGEIVFDLVLLDVLRKGGKSVTAVVKGQPVINDATLEDANDIGMHAFARVIDNGNDGIGTLLEICSAEFRDAWNEADMIISKGQANFETLISEGDERVYYLFMVKCPVVAEYLQRPTGDIVLGRSSRHRDAH